MQFSQALNPRRIARTLITVIGLSFISTVLPPVIAPLITAPAAHAVTETVSASSAKTIVIPTGVYSITIDAVGGSGGKGGDDVNTGDTATAAGHVVTTFAVNPGDVIGLYGGKSGGAGGNGASGNGGGTSGADTVPDNAVFLLNGNYANGYAFTGGTGGIAGTAGSSGGGGGGGAASVATINSEIVVIAGGGGGGGGTGSGSNKSVVWNGTLSPNSTNYVGGNGTNAPLGTCGGGTNNDGGGGGAGGGGYYGGNGGTSARIVDECAGTDGSPGGNYKATRATSVTDERIQRIAVDGYVTYTYSAEVVSACSKTTTTNDIYTIDRINYVGNCTWTVPSSVSVVDLFLVGGGGGGGADGGPGGGGGAGLLRTAIAVTPSSNINLKVGYGGYGGIFSNFSGNSGDSTIVTIGSTTYTANGGSPGTNGPSATGGSGGTAGNGGFAGGDGGTAAGSATRAGTGTAGKYGISNYFLSSSGAAYGGGGGGGGFTNSSCSAFNGALGRNGGGTGAYANSYGGVPGADGTSNTGGGGGGGLAVDTCGIRVGGGKGGSGTILIRYATNSADSFPASLTSALSGRWLPDGVQTLDSNRKYWIDASGTYANSLLTGTPVVSTQASTDGGYTTGSTKTNLIVSGGTGDGVTLVAGALSTYTMVHLERYPRSGGTYRRVVTASGGNFISGLYNSGNEGNAHHNVGWMTPTGQATAYKWMLSTDSAQVYRSNGKDVTYNYDNGNVNGATGPTGLGINNYSAEPTTWQMTDFVLFNRKLTAGEMRLMENYFARIYGITLDSDAVSSETDTAASFNGSSYFYTQYNEYYINDTFTAEFWLKPTSTCDSSGVDCAIYSLENTLVTRITGGTFWYALYGTTTGGWQYIDTGVKVKSGEWHHIAITKRGVANTNGSLDVYLDGQLAYTKAGDPYFSSTNTTTYNSGYTLNQSNTWTYIGARAVGGSPRFYGNIDEFKLWKVARTAAQVASDMNSADATDTNLQMYYDFNKSSLGTSGNVSNLAMGGPTRTDMIPAASPTYEEVKVTTTSGPYTTIKFPRTYITQYGGWKVPASMPQATVIAVGGAGGGGYGGVTNAPAGAGGGGGVSVLTPQALPGNSYLPIKVGQGGIGGWNSDASSVRNGQSTVVSINSGLTALGGGGGGNYGAVGAGGSSVATGGGGGGTGNNCTGTGPYYPGGTPITPGSVTSGYNAGYGVWGWGGSGGGARGAASNGDCNGANSGTPGIGYVDSITGIEYGRGGNSNNYLTSVANSGYTTANNGWGGLISYSTGNSNGVGYNGSCGVVIIRYITASKPTYTPPSNAYLNVGMTETFTTNVAQDSATAMLTRTFRWESTTAGSGGTYSLLKQGTGAANAAYSWIPSDTSTSGNQYLYRVIVTDSDTAGLFIQDTSTAVYAVINGTLTMTGLTTIKKAINVARSDTYSVFAGTSTYSYSLSPTIPGITIDSTTAMSPVLKISDTATVGTYLETITVTDSVSATFNIPLTITVTAPPSLTAGGEIVKNGQMLNLDAANRWGVQGVDGVAMTALAWNDMSGNQKNAATNNATAVNGTLCKAPTFSSDYGGYFNFNGTDMCYYTSYLGSQFTNSYTIETWIRPTSGSIAAGTQILSQMYDTVGEQISLVIGSLDLGNGNIYVGFYSGNGWRYANAPITPVANTWMHIVGTYDGTTLRTYLNGTLLGSVAYAYFGNVNTKGYYIGKRWDSTYFYTGGIGEVRAYNVALSDTQVALNYNATRYRFDSTNQSFVKPTQKYGALNIETFTVSSGGDTKTVTFAVGNRTGIKWDTATAGLLKLSVQDSLSAGTYYDTVTVTDNFGQATNLPIKFTISKADTITVIAGAATTQVFNNSPAALIPTMTITGLVSSDTGTVQRKYTGVDWTKPCAQGGGCEVGDTGPGGGTIFYISPTVIDSATGISGGGTYLEVAPMNWWGTNSETTTVWSTVSTSVTGTSSALGSGAENTRLINTALTTTSVAAKLAADLTFNGKSDWFLPSTLEVKEMYDALYAAGLNGGLSQRNYWASTQGSNTAQADTYWFGGGGMVSTTNKVQAYTVRPIRAYSPDTITVTTVPTNVDSYTVTVDTVTLTSGSLSNYQNVIFQQSGLAITQAKQSPLTVSSYVGTFGVPLTLTFFGGSGTGAVTESLTAASTATGCSLTSHVISSTTAGSCVVQIKKAYSRNYFAETVTASIYLMVWATNQPTPTVGSGATIGLGGVTSIIRDPNAAPTISGLSAYSAQAGVTSIIITGAGFNHLDAANVTVKFWRNKIASGFVISGDDTQIAVTVPAGTTTGKVIVETPNGIAVSEFPLTITP